MVAAVDSFKSVHTNRAFFSWTGNRGLSRMCRMRLQQAWKNLPTVSKSASYFRLLGNLLSSISSCLDLWNGTGAANIFQLVDQNITRCGHNWPLSLSKEMMRLQSTRATTAASCTSNLGSSKRLLATWTPRNKLVFCPRSAQLKLSSRFQPFSMPCHFACAECPC